MNSTGHQLRSSLEGWHLLSETRTNVGHKMYLVELLLYLVLRTKAFLCHAELRGFEVMAADVDTLGKYVEHIKSMTRNFRVPLQNNYDPDQIAAYFDHRPHVLIFRLLEVLLLL